MYAILKDYSRRREELVELDASQRLDKPFVDQATFVEQEAESIFKIIRGLERVYLWNASPKADCPIDISLDLLAKRLYPEKAHGSKTSWTERRTVAQSGRSMVYKMLRKMPKGGLLHVHFDAMVPVPQLLKWALQDDLLCVASSKPITTREIASIAGLEYTLLIEARPRAQVAILLQEQSLPMPWDEHYTGGWVPISLAASRYPFGLSEEPKQSFVNWLESLMTCSNRDHALYSTNHKIWQKFKATFAIGTGIIYHLPIFLKYLDYALESFIEDKICHVEARLLMVKPTMTDAEGNNDIGHFDWCNIIEQKLKEVNERHTSTQVTFNIIYTSLRALEKHQVATAMEDCLVLKAHFPGLIAGFDLVGHEEEGHNLYHFLSEFLHFKERQSVMNLHIPLILHAGETVDQSDPFDGAQGVDYNLVDALALGAKRLGHGFALVHHPHWMQRVKEQGILIEACPISNDILRLTSDTSNHPIFTLFNHGIPVALSNDDPSVFSNHGLTPDFFQFLIAQTSHSLMSAKALGFHSLIGSELQPESLLHAQAVFERQWQEYATWVVAGMGPLVGRFAAS